MTWWSSSSVNARLVALDADPADLAAARVADDLAAEGLREDLVAEADAERRGAGVHDAAQPRLAAEHPGLAVGDVGRRAGDDEGGGLGGGGRGEIVRAGVDGGVSAAPAGADRLLDQVGELAASLEDRGDGLTGLHDDDLLAMSHPSNIAQGRRRARAGLGSAGPGREDAPRCPHTSCLAPSGAGFARVS
jgi:hypothetical protein